MVVCNGVKTGDECWIVPQDGCSVPIHIHSALVVDVDSRIGVVHEGKHHYAVYKTEEEANQAALHKSEWMAEYHRGRLAKIEAVIATLRPVPVAESAEIELESDPSEAATIPVKRVEIDLGGES